MTQISTNAPPANIINIEIVLGQITDDFRDLEAYGHWLCGWDLAALRRRNEPAEDLEDALRVRLRVERDLEPSWRVIKADDDDGIAFRATDRANVAVSLIGGGAPAPSRTATSRGCSTWSHR